MPDARRRLADLDADLMSIDFSRGFDPYAALKHRFPDLYQARRLDPTVVIGREYDNGRECLSRRSASQLSPAQLEERRRAVERVQFMTGSPLGAAAFGLASLAGASLGARDAALAAGGVAETLGAVAPREPCRPAVRRRPLGGKSLRRGGHDLTSATEISMRRARLPALARRLLPPCSALAREPAGGWRRLDGKEMATAITRQGAIFWRKALVAPAVSRAAISSRSRRREPIRHRCRPLSRLSPGNCMRARS